MSIVFTCSAVIHSFISKFVKGLLLDYNFFKKAIIFYMNKYLECGEIANTHGIRGAVLINSWCDSPETLSKIKTLYLKKNGDFSPIKVESSSVYKHMVLAYLSGIKNINDAIPLKGTILYADRKDIPISEGDHFIADLIGLKIIDIDTGKIYGTLSDVFCAGASDIYTVRTPDSKDVLIPAVKEFVRKIDLENGIFIKPIEGMFD